MTKRKTSKQQSDQSRQMHLLAGGDARHRSGLDDANRRLTPPPIVARVKMLGHGGIELDPATEPSNPTGAKRFYTRFDDGLTRTWGGRRAWLVFVNPPYANLEDWLDKAIREGSRGARIVMLLPARFDTRYHQQMLNAATDLVFVKGRLKFRHPDEKGPGSPAPFASVLVGVNQSVRALADLGRHMVPTAYGTEFVNASQVKNAS